MGMQQRISRKPGQIAAIGIAGIVAGVAMMIFILSTPVQGNSLQPGVVMAAGLQTTHQEMPQVNVQPQTQAVPLQVGDNAPTAIAALLAQTGQQPASVSGRFVYAVPAVTSPVTTAILQNLQPDATVYVVHPLAGWGKSVSTTAGWFRCADIVGPSQYNGSQVEIENWTLLTQQERMEALAACNLSTIAG
jgi:hypothetical protein